MLLRRLRMNSTICEAVMRSMATLHSATPSWNMAVQVPARVCTVFHRSRWNLPLSNMGRPMKLVTGARVGHVQPHLGHVEDARNPVGLHRLAILVPALQVLHVDEHAAHPLLAGGGAGDVALARVGDGHVRLRVAEARTGRGL